MHWSYLLEIAEVIAAWSFAQEVADEGGPMALEMSSWQMAWG